MKIRKKAASVFAFGAASTGTQVKEASAMVARNRLIELTRTSREKRLNKLLDE